MRRTLRPFHAAIFNAFAKAGHGLLATRFLRQPIPPHRPKRHAVDLIDLVLLLAGLHHLRRSTHRIRISSEPIREISIAPIPPRMRIANDRRFARFRRLRGRQGRKQTRRRYRELNVDDLAVGAIHTRTARTLLTSLTRPASASSWLAKISEKSGSQSEAMIGQPEVESVGAIAKEIFRRHGSNDTVTLIHHWPLRFDRPEVIKPEQIKNN